MAEQVKFYGIDRMGRPVFRSLKFDKNFFGLVDILFDGAATEAEVLEQIKAEDLLFFGNHFDCEPMGNKPSPPLEIVRESPKTAKEDKPMSRKFAEREG